MLKTSLVLLSLILAACDRDETLTAYGAGDTRWVLHALDGEPWTELAELTFPEPGRIAGTGPCNRFSGALDAPYPWFSTGPLMVTRRACPALGAETRFLQALGAMTEAEVLDDTMILRNAEGREMVFKAAGSANQ